MKVKKVKMAELARFVKDAIASGADVRFKIKEDRRGGQIYMRSCFRKVKYGRQETALRACQDMAAKGAGQLESYECKFCGKWHIGHRNQILALIRELGELATSKSDSGQGPDRTNVQERDT